MMRYPLKATLKGVWGVFGVQNTWEAGVKEEEQGKRLWLAKAAGVQHFVYEFRRLGRAQDQHSAFR